MDPNVRNPHIPSCSECRARKARCSKERPVCARCRQLDKGCIYPPKKTRTPLTRAHLAGVENRLNRFEIALQRLFPAGGVEQIVQSLVRESTDEIASLPEDSSLANPLSDPITADPSLDTMDLSLGLELDSPPVIDTTGNHKHLIDAYFINYHPVYPFVHETSFRAECESRPPTAHGLEWDILYNAILAMGSWCCHGLKPGIDLEFYGQAVELLKGVSVLDVGNRTLIQGLVLLHELAQKSGIQEKSLQYLSIAARMAMNLGYHRDFADETLSLLEKEMRRRVWWTLYIFDSCAAKSFGLPLLLPESSFIKTERIRNIRDESLYPQTTFLPVEVDGPTPYTGLIAQAQFHLMANGIYRSLIAYPTVSLGEVSKLECRIDTWRETLPSCLTDPSNPPACPSLRFTGERLRICEKNLRILLLRPYLMAWTADDRNGDHRALAFRCVEIARESMALVLGCLRRVSYPRTEASFLLYCLFHVVLIYTVFWKRISSLHAGLLVRDIQEIQTTLVQSQFSNDAQAYHFLTVLNQLCMSLGPSNATGSSIASLAT
ncbi:hypothetical protein BO94DRAFT_143759 [Aspergillus sclerotioniger CBS 115572]|uniref:Zn(2)-C6 fungal-type domain-containing protein n=1 Tax=Aspergillus sclerotioniger CBS 115572 TaxID=1450535 RepID=A0A317XC21_9EURO|nr:hypothetical protein BO94DRAFT_143759 [Aspergillus sclerotioniger CBS 115572]PWY96059.1 hypothetical protein BO94DRAFT_143759 [Aspergillus sclerotioniger CBS 115572]